MFDRGVQTETEKMSSAIMLETLQERYPNRYSLPGENENFKPFTKAEIWQDAEEIKVLNDIY